jgi:alkylated DNA repair dioxygenase AlkB
MAEARPARRFHGEREQSAPDGLEYRPEMLSADEERALVARFSELPLREFEFHGYVGKRRTFSFGWRYDFTGLGLRKAGDMPSFLLGVRESAASLAGVAPSDLQHALVTEYPPGAALGWHKDKAVFGKVVGLSLVSACRLRFRRKAALGWERWSILLEPRSGYLLTGSSRSQWEHSIPAVPALRYSLTFRTLERTTPRAGRL